MDPHAGMRGISRRRLLGAALAVAGTSVLAGCGQSASSTAPAAQATSAEAKPTGVSGGAPTGPTPTIPAGANVVSFWIPWGQPERQSWVQDWGAKFHDQYPDQALKMEFVGFANMRQRWIAAQQAGQMPELLCTSFQEVGSAYVAGAIAPADEAIKDIGGASAFLDAPLSIYQYQNAYYGLPLYVFPRMLYYRKELYAAKSLQPPTDWDSWYQGTKALTQSPDLWGSALAPNDHAPEEIDYLMRGQGSALFDKDGNVQLGSAEGQAAVDMLARLIRDTGPQGMANYTEDDQVKLFVSKDVGTILTWPALLQWVAQQASQHVSQIGVVTPPGKTTPPTPITSNIGFGLGKSAKNLDGAQKYLKFIMQDEPSLAFLHSIPGVFPVTKSVAASPNFTDDPILKQYPDVVQASLEASNSGVEAGYLYGFNPTNQLALTTTPGLPEMLQAIVLQNTPVSQAVDDQVKRMNAAIAQARR